jgi:hypothetical protein
LLKHSLTLVWQFLIERWLTLLFICLLFLLLTSLLFHRARLDAHNHRRAPQMGVVGANRARGRGVGGRGARRGLGALGVQGARGRGGGRGRGNRRYVAESHVNEQGKTVCADCRKQYQTRQTFLRWEFDSFSCLTPDCRHLCRAAPHSAGELSPAVQALSPARSTVESPDQTIEETRHLTLENGQNNAPHTTDARPDDEPEDEFEMSFIGDGDLNDHQF